MLLLMYDGIHHKNTPIPVPRDPMYKLSNGPPSIPEYSNIKMAT